MSSKRNRRSKGNPQGGEYAVGYGRPPLNTRFKPGQSGNPRGRRKGVRNFETDLKATLKAPVRVNHEGKPKRISTQEAMLLRLREKALSGDARSLDLLIGLAQRYADEPQGTPRGLTADDTAILTVFANRILSGAVDLPVGGVAAGNPLAHSGKPESRPRVRSRRGASDDIGEG